MVQVFGRQKNDSEVEAMALVAEAIRRSLDRTIDDTQLVVGMAMTEQVDRLGSRRARRAVNVLGPRVDQGVGSPGAGR